MKTAPISGDNHPDDFNGHAVHVMGIIAGNGKKSTGSQYDYRIRGIAPNASIVSLRVLDKYGAGTDSAVIAAIQRAIQLKGRYNIRVINLSLGRPVYHTVGTLSRADDKITSYSSKGPTLIDHVVKPDLVAPGNRILSLRDNGSYLDNTYPTNRVPVYVYSTRYGYEHTRLLPIEWHEHGGPHGERRRGAVAATRIMHAWSCAVDS